jgi:bacterioferritin
MKGSPAVIKVLNGLLSHELTAVSQYIVHSEECENWGYDKLGGVIQKRAVEEMKHAEKLIARVIFLEGRPIVSELQKMHIGADVPKMFAADHVLEEEAIRDYNAAIVTCGEAKDFATREILEHILNDEDRHIDDIEAINDQIEQMGIQVFLSNQI